MDFERLKDISADKHIAKLMIDRLTQERELADDLKDSEALTARIDALLCDYHARLEALQRQRADIIRGLAALPERQRSLILLYYDAGMKWDDIACALSLSLSQLYRLRGAAFDQRRFCGSSQEGKAFEQRGICTSDQEGKEGTNRSMGEVL